VATAVAVRAAEPPAVGATPEPPAPPGAPAARADGVRSEAPVGPDGEPLYRRSYWIPLAEVVAVAAALNFTHRNLLGSEWAHSNLSTARTNLMRWTYDTDPFGTNNIMHPYNGAIYHGAARSMGLDPWQSFGYAFLGSALWEVAGETEPASINDQIMTPFGGAFLGEVLYRSAVLALGPGHERPGFWRGLGALLLSPPAGVNRMIFGDTYRTFDFDRRPVTYFQIFAGGGVAYDRTPREQTGDQTAVTAHAGLHLAFGLPDERGFPVRHPFDHFDLAFTLAATEREAPFGALFIRGIRLGLASRGAGAACGGSPASSTTWPRGSSGWAPRRWASPPPASWGPGARWRSRAPPCWAPGSATPAPPPSPSAAATTTAGRPPRWCWRRECSSATPPFSAPSCGSTWSPARWRRAASRR
jgi:hypothetical protein